MPTIAVFPRKVRSAILVLSYWRGVCLPVGAVGQSRANGAKGCARLIALCPCVTLRIGSRHSPGTLGSYVCAANRLEPDPVAPILAARRVGDFDAGRRPLARSAASRRHAQ